MAFTPKTWVDRAVEFAGRRLLIAVSGLVNGFDVSRSEGTVFVAGDEIDATNLNDLETRISNEFTLINSAISGLEETVLWTNPSPTSSFTGPSTLSEAIEGFTDYAIVYATTTSTTAQVLNTGKIPYNRSAMLHFNLDNYIYRRVVSSISGTSIIFSNGLGQQINPPTGVEDNTKVIPLKIIGYK